MRPILHKVAALMRRPALDLSHYFLYKEEAWKRTWLGVPILKLPQDLWAYQELLFTCRPTLIIECGACSGGSALYFAHLMDAMESNGRIISIDVTVPAHGFPEHPRVEYLIGSSTAGEMVDRVRGMIRPGDKVMVILDSDHSQRHVAAELDRYAGFVTLGQYLICEDTNVNGHPVNRAHGPGPMEALSEWLPEHPEFASDNSRQPHLSFHPRGWLIRI
jgi:cephalosporin hydroxylase